MKRRTEIADERMFLNQRFESVQSLRGIAALFVLMQHICFIERGSFGVDLFFLISGFMIMYTTEKNAKQFLVRRAIRIIPLYYIMTIASYVALLVMPQLFEQTTASFVYLIKSLLFIPFSMDGVTQPLLRVGWTVNYEVFFYLLFFLSMKLSHRYRALICSGILLVLVCIGIWVPKGLEPFSFWTDSILLEFVAGMILFYVFRFWYTDYASAGWYSETEAEKKEKTLPRMIEEGDENAVGIMLLFGSVLLLAGEFISYDSPFLCSFPRVVRWGIPSVQILCMTFAAGLRLHMPKFLTALGDMSFSIYLIHYYPMRFLSRLLDNTKQPDMTDILMTGGAVLFTLLGAWISYVLIEKKLTNLLRAKLVKKVSSATSSDIEEG